jgi:hypothetical protein
MINGEEQIAALLRMAGKRLAVPETAQHRVRAAVHEEWRRNVRRRVAIRWTSLAVAACLAAVILSRINIRTRPPAIEAPRLVATTELVSGNAFIDHARLSPESRLFTHSLIETTPDAAVALRWTNRGSLRIAGGSTIRFDSERQISVDRGAVYFSSTGSGRAIAVRTPLGIVRDAGTQFEVRVETDSIRVRVREGAIDLQRGSRSERAIAGTELAATRAGTIERRRISRSGPEWDWVLRAAPPIALTGSVRDILEVTAREKGLTLTFADARSEETATRTALHGSVPVSPDEALTAVTAASPFTFRIEDETLTVKRR